MSWTFELANSRAPPIGAKMTPTTKRMGKTVRGVRMGWNLERVSGAVRKRSSLGGLARVIFAVGRRCWPAFCSLASCPCLCPARYYSSRSAPSFATWLPLVLCRAQEVKSSRKLRLSTEPGRSAKSEQAVQIWKSNEFS